ncbi:hypothetical protein BD769DRAFT_1667571 [Suillus cothurnatus]|nr:hypothetical protein BD769DRAFT_1667571 [Suillus cothurnatus]
MTQIFIASFMGFMRKMFIQKLAEFKQLGSHIIYADFSRILLATLKPPGTAHTYATSITTAVTSHELFRHMYLKIQRFYDFLLFMDSANMGGVTFLLPAIQDDFGAVIQFFIVKLFKNRIWQKHNEGSRMPYQVLQNLAPEPTQPDPNRINEIDMTREFIARKLTRKLLSAG